MNSLSQLLAKKRKELLSVFFTAGYPALDSTHSILLSLQERGVDFAEVGMPYSDPLADGPVIQHTNSVAIDNGMNLPCLFEQLKALKGQIQMPLVLMGYLNPVLQFGPELFCQKASDAGVSGVILPDLPVPEYREGFQELFHAHGLHAVFLITPLTQTSRIREIDALSTAFIYAVSASSTTGNTYATRQADFGVNAGREMTDDDKRDDRVGYLKKLKAMQLQNPVVVGFGIDNQKKLQDVWKYASGAIIGSAYLKQLQVVEKEEEAAGALFRNLKIKKGQTGWRFD